MDVIYERGTASAAEVRENIPDAPSYSAVRALLRILEDKGHLKHKQQANRYIYLPTHPRDKAARAAIERVVRTFFRGSPADAVAALLEVSDGLPDEELDRLRQVVEQARSKSRQ